MHVLLCDRSEVVDFVSSAQILTAGESGTIITHTQTLSVEEVSFTSDTITSEKYIYTALQ